MPPIKFSKKVRIVSPHSYAVGVPSQYIKDGIIIPGQEYQVTLERTKKVRK